MQIPLDTRVHPRFKYTQEKRRKPSTELCHPRSRRGRLSDILSIHAKTRRSCAEGEERVSGGRSG